MSDQPYPPAGYTPQPPQYPGPPPPPTQAPPPGAYPPPAGPSTYGPPPMGGAPPVPPGGYGPSVPPGGYGPPMGSFPPPLPPRKSPRRLITAGVTAIVVLAALGAYLFVAGSKSPRARLDAAVAATQAAHTAKVQMAIDTGSGGMSFSFKGTGTIDFDGNSAEFTITVLGQQATVIAVNHKVYEKIGPVVSQRDPGKTWVVIPSTKLSGSTTNPASLLTQNFMEHINKLIGTKAAVTSLGTTVIDNNTDQGYRVTMTPQALQGGGGSLPAPLGQSLKSLKHLILTAYVTPYGYLQRLVLSADAVVQGKPVTMSFSLTFSDFGTAAPVTAPPATKTVTLSQFPGGLSFNNTPSVTTPATVPFTPTSQFTASQTPSGATGTTAPTPSNRAPAGSPVA